MDVQTYNAAAAAAAADDDNNNNNNNITRAHVVSLKLDIPLCF